METIISTLIGGFNMRVLFISVVYLDSRFTLQFCSGSWHYLSCSSVILFPVVATHLISNQGCTGICFLCSHLCFGLITSTCCSCSSYEISWWTYHSVVSGEHNVCTFPSRVLSSICFMDPSIQFQYPAY